MIEESYVSLETAKLLKEVGFREHSRCMYYEEKDGSYKLYKCLIGDYDVSTDKSYEGDLYGERYLAPTQALAARWLREAHGIHVFPVYQYLPEKWSYVIQDMAYVNSEKGTKLHTDVFDSCEESLEAGLKRGLKLI